MAALIASCANAAAPTFVPGATLVPSADVRPSTSPTANQATRASAEASVGSTQTPTASAPLPTPSPKPVAKPAARASGAPLPSGPGPSPSVDIIAVIDAYSASFTATITLLDLADDELAVTVAFLDPDSGQSDALGTYTVPPSGQISNAVPPGTYRLDFREPAGSATGPTCTIQVKKDDTYSFVAVPGAIAVSRAGFTPTTVRDLFVATSTLCRA